MSWRHNFARIAEVCGREKFPIDIVRDVVRERDGREPKQSALRRQFKSYIEHGYVTHSLDGEYQLTDKLFALIGFRDGVAPSNENEASAADAVDASETALEAQ